MAENGDLNNGRFTFQQTQREISLIEPAKNREFWLGIRYFGVSENEADTPKADFQKGQLWHTVGFKIYTIFTAAHGQWWSGENLLNMDIEPARTENLDLFIKTYSLRKLQEKTTTIATLIMIIICYNDGFTNNSEDLNNTNEDLTKTTSDLTNMFI